LLKAIAWRVALALLLIGPVMQAYRLGGPIAGFTLQDVNGQKVRFPAIRGKVAVVMFVSIRCPISNAFNARINTLYNQFADRVQFIVIYSNRNESTEDVGRHAKLMGYDFPVYKDVDNVVADLFGANITPDSFVINQMGAVSYHGYIEDAPNPTRTKNPGLRLAIEAALENRNAPMPETHAFGCSIRRVPVETN
jgi:peroxiredoxin